MRQLLLLALFCFALMQVAQAQIDRSGPIFGIGMGAGYSQHADSYTEQDTLIFSHIESFSGMRVMTIDLKLGWAYTSQLLAYLTLKYTPPAIVSPYRSTYLAFALSYTPPLQPRLLFTGGAGVNKVRDKKGDLSRGILTNLGVGYEFSSNFMVETYAVFGEMDNTPVQGRRLSSSREFLFNLSFSYLFYRRRHVVEIDQ